MELYLIGSESLELVGDPVTLEGAEADDVIVSEQRAYIATSFGVESVSVSGAKPAIGGAHPITGGARALAIESEVLYVAPQMLGTTPVHVLDTTSDAGLPVVATVDIASESEAHGLRSPMGGFIWLLGTVCTPRRSSAKRTVMMDSTMMVTASLTAGPGVS